MAFNEPIKEKKPEIGAAPNKAPVQTPKGAQFSAPKAQPSLNKQKAHELSGSKIQPGSPSLNAKHTPVGIQQKPFETQKGMDKRTNKLFAKTGQPTLGQWNRDKSHNVFAGPDKIKFNPAFDKTKEINQSLANRQKIIDQGFAPKYKLNHSDTTEKPEAWTTGNYDSYLNQDGSVAVHFNGDHVGNFKNKEEAENFVQNDTERQQKYLKSPSDYELNSKLDEGKVVNLDSGLLPYEHGFETNGNEDLAVDAKKTLDGKYEVYMYPETENGPVGDYADTPTHTFDSFEELKEFMDNGYREKESENEQRERASKLFGTDLSKKTGPVYDPALGIAGSPSDIDDIDKMQELIDSTLQKYGRIGAGMYDDLDANGYYLDANNKVRRK